MASLTAALIAAIVVLLALAGALVLMLRRSEERRLRFAAMFENSNELMCVYRTDGSIVRANAAALKRLGYGAEIVGRHYSVHIAPDSRETSERVFEQAAGGRANEFSTVLLDASGGHVHVVASLSPIVVRNRIVGVIGAARDVSAEQEYEEQLLHNRERFRGLFEQNFYAMMTVKLDGTISAINVAMERLCGYRNEELVGKSTMVLTPPERRDLAQRRHVELTIAPAPMSYESILLCRGDHGVPVAVDILPIRVGGRVEGYYMTIKDLTEERALRSRLGEKDARVSALYRVASSGAIPALQIVEALLLGTNSLDIRYGFLTEVSDEHFTVRHRCGPEDGFMPVGFTAPLTVAIGKRLAESPRAIAVHDLTAYAGADELHERAYPWKSLIGSRLIVDGKPYGSLIFLDTRARTQPFEPADIDFVDLLATLMSGAVSRELAQQRLEEGSMYDPLTGLANRSLLEQSIRRAIATAGRRHRRFAVQFVDLDRFKPINDEHGHATGDLVLKEVARRLKSAVRAEDIVARVGGDEFVVLQTDIEDPQATHELSERVTVEIVRPMEIAGLQFQIGCSIGIAAFPTDGKTPEELLRAADAAMYRAKARNRKAD